MALNQSALDALCAWCRDSFELAAERREARARFFGDDDPSPVDYLPGAGDHEGRERRFLGYFAFDCVLSSGVRPIDVAIQRLDDSAARQDASTAVAGARFVVALVSSIVKRTVYLELGDEQFEVRNPIWAANLVRGTAVAARLVPTRYGHWLVGPGWVNLPFQLGPGMRSHLAEMQFEPIDIERLLQRRRSGEHEARPAPPQDEALAEAVERMANWAREHGHERLVLPAAEWTERVVRHLDNPATTAFYREVLDLAGPLGSTEEINELAGLASNIWNNTPQPDRDGKTANELAHGDR